jgi:hypothetical protein
MAKTVKKVLTDKEQRAVVALCDVLLPSNQTMVNVTDTGIPDRVMDILERESELKRVKLYLWLIENPVVNLVVSLTLKGFSDMTPPQKRKYLTGLSRNPLLARLKVFGARDTITQAIEQATNKK